MEKRIVVVFETTVTVEVQREFDAFVKANEALGYRVFGYGGGIKNPKP